MPWKPLTPACPFPAGIVSKRTALRLPERRRTLMGPAPQINPRAPKASAPLRVHTLNRPNGPNVQGFRPEAIANTPWGVSPESEKSLGEVGRIFISPRQWRAATRKGRDYWAGDVAENGGRSEALVRSAGVACRSPSGVGSAGYLQIEGSPP